MRFGRFFAAPLSRTTLFVSLCEIFLLRAFAPLREIFSSPRLSATINRPLCCTMATLSCWARKGRSSMNLEKFTDRAKGFLQAAQQIAIRMNHQPIATATHATAHLAVTQGRAAVLSPTRAGVTLRDAERRGKRWPEV